MNLFNNMLPWYQWLVLGLVPPLIFLLYFLKLRRTPVEVPSTYLWVKTVEDLHVNDIWQKLRKNLLLLLQLLAVLMLMLGCLNPGCQGEKLLGDRFIFLIDQSASMSATDLENGKTRFEESKAQISDLIDQMKSTDAGMLISFSDQSVVHQSYTTNKSLLKRKLNSIKQTQRGSDMNEALLAASGLANPGRIRDNASQSDVQIAEALAATLFIFSDGAVKKVPNFFLGNLTPDYRPIGSIDAPDNVGITAFSINDQLSGGGQVQVFARLQNSGLEDKTVSISLFVDNELQDARNVAVAGLGATPLNFDVSEFVAGLESATPVRLVIEDDDVYAQDNVAYCVLNPPTIANVLIISDHNDYLEHATSTDRIKSMAAIEFQNRDFLEDKTYQRNAALGFYDLIVYDQCSPKQMPTCNTVFFGALPAGDQWSVKSELEPAPIIDITQGHPLMYDVLMGNVNIIKTSILNGPKGSLSLLESPQGSMMMVGPRGGFEDLVIGFPLLTYDPEGDISNNTDWPKNLSFPFFVQNMIVTMAGAARFNATKTNSPGQQVKIKPQVPYPAIDIKTPDGKKVTVKPRPDSSFTFSQTEKTGIYSVSESGSSDVDQLFAVNQLNRLESDLKIRDQLNLGYAEVKRTTSIEPARKSFWTWLVLLALVIISIEWYVYNRRVFI